MLRVLDAVVVGERSQWFNPRLITTTEKSVRNSHILTVLTHDHNYAVRVKE